MIENWDTQHIDLNNLLKLARGDRDKITKYLRQFLELIPPRMEQLKHHIAEKDRKKIRQTLHQMSPQLQFFEVEGVMTLILRLELEYQSISWEELTLMGQDLLSKLYDACKEVEEILEL